MFYEGSALILVKGNLQSRFRIHDNRSVPCHGFSERFAGMKIVKHKERIKLEDLIITEGALQMDPRAFDSRFTLPDFLYVPYLRHCYLLSGGKPDIFIDSRCRGYFIKFSNI